MPCYADLGANFKVPSEFKQVEIDDSGEWDGESPILIYDKYELKTDSNIYITVQEYNEEDWNAITSDESDEDLDFVYELDNNMVVTNHHDAPEQSYGSVSEVVELDGTSYIVDITFWGNTLNTKEQEKNATHYLDEFNKLNNVKPIKM